MRVVNRNARRNYKITDTVESGLVLTGAEAKAASAKRVDISKSHAKIIKGEAYLINASIHIPGGSTEEVTRTRKLLIHKKQINSLLSKIKQHKLTLVPIALYNKGRIIKLELGLGKGQKAFEKRQKLRKRDIKREVERELKNY